jgi:hypothetical protein
MEVALPVKLRQHPHRGNVRLTDAQSTSRSKLLNPVVEGGRHWVFLCRRTGAHQQSDDTSEG